MKTKKKENLKFSFSFFTEINQELQESACES